MLLILDFNQTFFQLSCLRGSVQQEEHRKWQSQQRLEAGVSNSSLVHFFEVFSEAVSVLASVVVVRENERQANISLSPLSLSHTATLSFPVS